MYRIPSPSLLGKMMELMKAIVFPEYSELSGPGNVVEVRAILLSLVSADIADQFIHTIPEISRLLHTDVAAIEQNDPAVSDTGEVILCYPAVTVMLHYRTAHSLYKLGVQRIPRMLTEMAHSVTGIDINPAAQIGEYFAIDHGTGIVIGQTCIIGDHVMLYQGVTLGAKNFKYNQEGLPLDVPRHPIIEDNVTIYSNTSILGRVTIGHDTVVGGNIWLTTDVPAGSMVVQGKGIIKKNNI